MGADDKSALDEFGELVDRVKDAAIEAEYATGDREATEEEAKARALVRVGKIIGGFGLVILGIILMPLPGPGALIVAGGLALLATEFVWADKLLRIMRNRMPGIPEDGKIERRVMVMYGVVMVIALIIAFFWGQDIKAFLLDDIWWPAWHWFTDLF